MQFTQRGTPRIDGAAIRSLESVLADLESRAGLRLHFIGHTDGSGLSDAEREVYGGARGRSRFYAEQVAHYVRSRLGLAQNAVTWEGRGAAEPLADPATAAGRQRNRRVEVRVWYRDPADAAEPERYVPPAKTQRVRVCRQEPACVIKRRRRDTQVIQLRNAVAPIRFASTRGRLPEGSFDELAAALERLGDVPHLRVRFVGHTDAAALDGEARARYGDATGLGRAYAREVAAAARARLGLDEHQLMIDSRGASEPVAPNGTERGRALNRRVEIEIWHDARGSESEVSDVRACPAEGDLREYVTEEYMPDGEPPLEPIPFVDGDPEIGDDWVTRLGRVLDELADARNVRVNFIGHVDRELLDRRAARIYGDARGLSEVRARRVMEAVTQRLERDVPLTYEGKGFSEPLEDPGLATRRIPDGRVRAQILRDVAVPPDPDWLEEVVEVTRSTEPVTPYALAPMRITVDGERIRDAMPHGADVQRCTDVALNETRVEVRYDAGRGERRLNVIATPATIGLADDPDTESVENRTTFRGFTNYGAYIERAEVRLYEPADPTTVEPVDVVPLGPDMTSHWHAEPSLPAGLKYVLRVYDDQGRFDETAPKRLWLLHDPAAVDAQQEAGAATRARLAGLDETLVQKVNVPVEGGAITVTGRNVPEGHTPWVMGEPVPVDDDRDFAVERLVPHGLHTVEVAVLDEGGNGDVYLRDLRMGREDWYTIGIADITAGIDDTNGPARLVTQDDQHYNSSGWVDGRLAFYTNGHTDAGWEITGSADTREGPLDEIFSNFTDKNPDALFRRLDGDRHYPTFGDDSTTVEDAPTSGKFYVKAEKDRTFGMWGNFEAELLDNELAQIDRGLYGAYGHYEGRATTNFGERRTQADLFAAEPGTIAAREEFRGTGGSLYFLRHQDIVQGSERIRVEVRDQDSGLVLESNSLVAGEDYDIDAIQGRVLLTSPLPSSADGSSLVQAGGSLAGNPVFLVVRYEYTPGFDELDDVAVGGRVSQWFGDHLQLGVTGNRQEQVGAEQSLAGVDVTWRQTAGTWLRVESAQTDGVGTTTLLSDDGGFDFETGATPAPDASAGAWRVESAADFSDVVRGTPGNATLYLQRREAGFSAPGQTTTRDVDQAGGSLDVPVTERTTVHAEYDQRAETQGLDTQTLSTDVGHRLDERWKVTGGVRYDRRDDDSPVVPDTQNEGHRTDLGVRLDYTPEADWSAYTFAQATAEATETREDNDRLGVGGSTQITERLRGEGELSGGDTGTGARLGTEYLYSEATRLYAGYSLDNERQPATGVLERQGRFVTGFRTRYSEATTVYGEERYAHGDVPTGLTHAYGIDTQASTNWAFGASAEVGTLEDPRTGAETERQALGLSGTRTGDALDYRGAVELRTDETETNERTTYLLKNRLQYQVTPASRVLGKLNLSQSDSSQGEFFDGEYVEAVLGYGHRPVDNDRWNTLFKYTYFYNLPAPEQEIADGSSAEFIQKSHVVSADTIYRAHAELEHRRQVRDAHRRAGGEPREPGVLPEPRPARGAARRLARAAPLGRAPRGPSPRPGRRRGHAQRRAGRHLPPSRRQHQARHRLQLHRLLRRPDRPELRQPGRVHQPRGQILTSSRLPCRKRHDIATALLR
ncbi:MAG: hypothetical protein U5K43_15750 [Halofilum sp. (in: g-proteobacteria)]|nr:hypothetical protein [Halofilum sp. (in: g-proteobacteria)]